MKFTLKEIIEATGAKIIKNENVDNLKFTFSTDTRTIKEGEIYLPLKGENFDGEKFVDKALEAGAAGYFCTDEKTCELNPESQLILLVKDTLSAYLGLASFYREKINPKTVAITGSSGKTTTKEMAYCVSFEKFRTHKSELNFNNEIGICKTILSMPEDTQVLIVEMGMRGQGEIELLSKCAKPDITIIANVGRAHIGRLGSRENIARAKCEIIMHQREDGLLIAHNDELIKKTISLYWTSPTLRQTFFSLEDAKIVERKIGHSKFIYKNSEYELNIEGDYNVQNALASIEMGLELKMTPEEIKNGLKKYRPIEKRWEVEKIEAAGKEFKVINDSYNANPESTKAALTTFLELYNPPLLVVLGDMGELGDREAIYHQEIGEFLAKELETKKDVKVLTVGNLANEISVKLNEYGILAENFEDAKQCSRYILENIKNGTTIILKASRSMKFEQIIGNLKEN